MNSIYAVITTEYFVLLNCLSYILCLLYFGNVYKYSPYYGTLASYYFA